MQELIKVLHDNGFTTLNIALAVAVIVLWRLIIARDAKQTTDREKWHEETRAQLEEVKAHTKACEEDRIKLKAQVELLSRACSKGDCPRRLG